MQNRTPNPTLREIITSAFDKTYIADGVETADALLPENAPSALTRVATFLGLPNRILDKSEGQSFKNLFYNFIGYQGNVSTYKKVINGILIPFNIAINLISTPFKLMLNIAKLGTEMLPLAGMRLCGKLSYFLINLLKDESKISAIRAFAGIGIVLNFIPAMAFGITYSVGRAITSPINAAKDAWNTGNINGGILGKVLGSILALSSICISFTAYTLLAPIVAQAIISPILSAAAAHLPAAIVAAANTVASAVTPFLTAVGKAFIPVVNWIMPQLTLGLVHIEAFTAAASPALLGMGGLISLTATTVGNVASKYAEKFKKWWHKPAEQKNGYIALPEQAVEESTKLIQNGLSNGKNVGRRISREASPEPERELSPQLIASAPIPIRHMGDITPERRASYNL